MISPKNLTDVLANERTKLANERTLLAYIRTAIGLLAAGAGLFYLFETAVLEIVGATMVVAAAGTLSIGVVRYRRLARDLAALERGHDSGGSTTA